MTDTLIEKVQANVPKMVVVHPTVLLSVVDHYNRIASGTSKRVVGVLLGEYGDSGVLDVTNCYAVPFEEDASESNVWFFDHIYHETMYNMFKKINFKEKIVGWYSTGPQIKKADININEILRRYNSSPMFVVIKVDEQSVQGMPVEAYCTEEEVDENGNLSRQFIHLPSSISASQAEDVGVEHLLRDIKDASKGQLSKEVGDKVNGFKALQSKLADMRTYMEAVISGKYPPNWTILHNMQDIFNLLPNLQVEQMVKSFSVKSNDYMHVIYVCSLIKTVIGLHNLINNRINTRETELEQAKTEKEELKKKEEEQKKKLEESNKKVEEHLEKHQ